jgi:hypothetical protein
MAVHGIIQFYLGRYNTEEKINDILAPPSLIQRLRELSLLWSEEKRAVG